MNASTDKTQTSPSDDHLCKVALLWQLATPEKRGKVLELLCEVAAQRIVDLSNDFESKVTSVGVKA